MRVYNIPTPGSTAASVPTTSWCLRLPPGGLSVIIPWLFATCMGINPYKGDLRQKVTQTSCSPWFPPMTRMNPHPVLWDETVNKSSYEQELYRSSRNSLWLSDTTWLGSFLLPNWQASTLTCRVYPYNSELELAYFYIQFTSILSSIVSSNLGDLVHSI
jgi:hypothetical protein